MSDVQPKESTVFEIDGELFDAWGNPAEEEDDGVNYNRMSAKDLVDEVNRRNEGRDDEDKIVFDGKPKKAEVVEALEKDDKASAEDNEE